MKSAVQNIILSLVILSFGGCDDERTSSLAENRTKPCRINQHVGGFDGYKLYNYILRHYNERGWLSMIEKYSGAGVLDERFIYEYDDQGNITNGKFQLSPPHIWSETRYVYGPEGRLLATHKDGGDEYIESCEFDYDGDSVTKSCTLTDPDGSVTKIDEDHFFELSASGHLLSSFKPSRFLHDERRLYIYDQAGRMEAEYTDTNDFGNYNLRTHYERSPRGRLLTIPMYYHSMSDDVGDLWRKEVFAHNSAGWITEYQYFNTMPWLEEEELTWHSEYTYDELGRVVRQIRRRGETSVDYFSYEYDCENEPAKELPKCHPLIDHTTNFDYKCFHNVFQHTNCVCQTPLAKHIE